MEMAKSIIPPQLQKDTFGFVKLRKDSKVPFELNWPDKPYSYKEIQAWIDQGNNYGVLGGYGDLVIIDADTLELSHIVQQRLTNTFTVKSSRFAYHHYFICEEIKNKITILKKDNIPHGEIRSHGSQVVGPGSIHPEAGTRYTVVNDIEIAEVSREQIYSVLSEYITANLPKEDKKDIEVDSSNINIVDVLNKKNIYTRRIGDQLVCAHPVHGSTNNTNFVVNPEKNVWHCFRCNSGGGALSLIAVLEGLIQCQEAVSGGLRGSKFFETQHIAREKYGFNFEPKVALKEAENKDVNLPEDRLVLFETKIKTIPADTLPVKIPGLLDPILKEIASLNPVQSDVLLKHTIKEHFGFTNDDIKSYEDALRDYRKGNHENNTKSLSKLELLEILRHEEADKIIHPAQDYSDGLMTFSVKVKGGIFLITSDKRLFSLKDAQKEGFILKHETVDITRFSAKGISLFLDGKYEVNIPGLYQKVYDYIKRFICFPDEAYLHYTVLWVMGTYVFMLFRYYPYVWLNAEKGSGKTILMEILSTIAFNGELITNPTESVIFRDISNNLITMFIDEVEQLRRRDKDTYGSVISLLNAGFNKAGVVKRTESTSKGGFVIKSYTAYSPKMFAGINEIDDILQDRTVRIPLLRKKDNETVQRYKETPEVLELQRSIRDDLYVFALTYAKEIAEYYHKEGITGMEHLNNRELDIWEPVFLLANLVDKHSDSKNLTPIMETLSRKSLQEKQSDSVSQNETYKILTVLKVMLDELTPLTHDGDMRVFEAGRVLEYFKATEDFDWIEKTNLLTRRLKRVKVVSEQRRFDSQKKRVYILNLKDFMDLCERFKIE